MGLPAPTTSLSFSEYIGLESADGQARHELVDGRMWARTRGTWSHAMIASNMLFQLRLALRGRRCQAVSQDARVRIEAADMACYPDLLVVCDQRAGAPEDPDSTTNPLLLAEVLSRSTEAFDRGRKRLAYFELESLQHCVLISQDRPWAEVYTRAPDGWLLRSYAAGDRVSLPALDISLSVDAMYEGIDFSVTRGELSSPPVAQG